VPVVVVGAGVAGLVAATVVRDLGREVVVLEAGRVGGRCLSVPLGGPAGPVVELGAGHCYPFYRRTRAWLDRLGLGGQLRAPTAPAARWPLRGRELGGLVLCAADVLSSLPRLRLAEPERLAPLDTESIAAYARRRLGERFLRDAVRPAFEWNAFSPAESMSRALMLLAGRLVWRARPLRLSGGLGQLPRRLAAALPVVVGPAGRAVAVRAAASGGAEVLCADGSRWRGAALILAAPAGETLRLLGPSLPAAGELRRLLREVAHSRLVRLVCEVPGPGAAGWRWDDGGGPLLVAAGGGDGRRLVAAAAWAELADHVLGPGAEAGPLPPPAQERLAVLLHARTAGRLDPGTAAAGLSWGWPQAVTLFAPGHYRRLAASLDERRRLAAGRGVMPVVLAGDYLVNPTIEGAVVSGERAGRAAAGALRGAPRPRADRPYTSTS